MGTCYTSEQSMEQISTQRRNKGVTILPATNNESVKANLLLSVVNSIRNDPNNKEPIPDYEVIYDDREQCKMGLIKGVLSSSNLIGYMDEEQTKTAHELPTHQMGIDDGQVSLEYEKNQKSGSEIGGVISMENETLDAVTMVKSQEIAYTHSIKNGEEECKMSVIWGLVEYRDEEETTDLPADRIIATTNTGNPGEQMEEEPETETEVEVSTDDNQMDNDNGKEAKFVEDLYDEIYDDLLAVVMAASRSPSPMSPSFTDEYGLKESSYDIEDENEDIILDKQSLSKSMQDILDLDASGNIFSSRWGSWNEEDIKENVIAITA